MTLALEQSPIGLSTRSRPGEWMRWGLCFALVAGIQGALAVGYLIHDEPSPANEAPEAAIMIDLPPELALPPAESVESIASSAAEEVETPDAPQTPDTPPDMAQMTETTEAVPEPTPDETVEDLPEMEITDAIEPDVAEAVVEDAPVEPVTETVTAEVPEDVVEEVPPDEVVVSEVAPPPPPKAQPKPPVRKDVAKPKPAAKPAEKARPAPQRREASRAAVAGQRASGAGAPDANALKQFMSGVRAEIMRQRRSITAQGDGRTTTVRFTIGASGALGGVAVAKSSGDATLDAAAVAMVQRASPVAPIPAGVGRSSVSTRLPVRFD